MASYFQSWIKYEIEQWILVDLLAEKTRRHFEENKGHIEEVTGTFLATRAPERSVEEREEVIIKVKLQCVVLVISRYKPKTYWTYRLSLWDEPDCYDLSREALREIANLERLTESNCKSTPALISWSEYKQNDDMPCPGGYIVIIVMEKAGGQNLKNFGAFSLEERDRVRIALIKSLW